MTERTKHEKLDSVKATLIILSGRLTPAWRKDIDGCLALITEVQNDIRNETEQENDNA